MLQPQQLLSRCDAEIAQEIELVTVDILTQACDCFVRQGAVRECGRRLAQEQEGVGSALVPATASGEDFNDGLDMLYLLCDLDRAKARP